MVERLNIIEKLEHRNWSIKKKKKRIKTLQSPRSFDSIIRLDPGPKIEVFLERTGKWTRSRRC